MIGHKTNGYFGGNNDSNFWRKVAVSECCWIHLPVGLSDLRIIEPWDYRYRTGGLAQWFLIWCCKSVVAYRNLLYTQYTHIDKKKGFMYSKSLTYTFYGCYLPRTTAKGHKQLVHAGVVCPMQDTQKWIQCIIKEASSRTWCCVTNT